jgi:Zn-finger nucleic acid-binding protein
MSTPSKPVPLAQQPDARLRCPKDGQIMERVPLKGAAGVVVDRCAGCGAIWFDALELRNVLRDKKAVQALDTGPLDQRPANATIGQALGGMICPRDGTGLKRAADLQQTHIVMDYCPTCTGCLLDTGELSDLSEFSIGEKIKGLFGGKK